MRRIWGACRTIVSTISLINQLKQTFLILLPRQFFDKRTRQELMKFRCLPRLPVRRLCVVCCTARRVVSHSGKTWDKGGKTGCSLLKLIYHYTSPHKLCQFIWRLYFAFWCFVVAILSYWSSFVLCNIFNFHLTKSRSKCSSGLRMGIIKKQSIIS